MMLPWLLKTFVVKVQFLATSFIFVARYICTYSSAKFEYIINMYGISVDDLLEIIKKQCKDAEILKGLVIKYNIIGKVSIIDTIVKRVSSFAVGTKEMLEKCLVILDSVI